MERKNVDELPDLMRDIIDELIVVSKKSVSEYYKYNVSAGIIDEGSECFLGVNWEPANGDSTCAEVGAISSYLLSERKPIKYVVTFGKPSERDLNSENFCTPCGRCRQRLKDFCNKDTVFIAVNETGKEVEIFEMEELLPNSFGAENL